MPGKLPRFTHLPHHHRLAFGLRLRQRLPESAIGVATTPRGIRANRSAPHFAVTARMGRPVGLVGQLRIRFCMLSATAMASITMTALRRCHRLQLMRPEVQKMATGRPP